MSDKTLPTLNATLPRSQSPRLSIVIPTLNEENSLPSLLEALQKQTFRDFEVIIADANSPDSTRYIADKYGACVVDGGLPGAGRNAGAHIAKGELLLFFDADVLPDSDFLETFLEEFNERGVDFATCPAEPLSRNTGDALILSSYNAYVLLTQTFWPHVPGFCILIKRDLHMAMDGFDETVHVAEDADYARRAGKRGSFGVMVTKHLKVSTRRFKNDGRFLTSMKYITWDLHRALFGEITQDKSDLFTYKFGHHNEAADRKRIMEILQQSPTDLAKRYLDVIKRQLSLFD